MRSGEAREHPPPPRWLLAIVGAVAAGAGVALSEASAWALRASTSPLDAVASGVRDLLPAAVIDTAIGVLGGAGKPALLGTLVLAVVLLGAYAASWSRRLPVLPDLTFVALAVVGLVATGAYARPPIAPALAVLVGLMTWVVVLRLLSGPVLDDRPRDGTGRRRFLVRLGGVLVGTAVLGVAGRVAGNARQSAEASRRLLRLPVSSGTEPAGADRGLEGLTPWRTPNDDFYVIHTAIAAPTVRAEEWRLRIHGMVDREVVLDYGDIVSREMTQAWVTLACVSNEVGGDLVGNAWWSGVPVRELLARAGVQEDADCVRQTSHDGWTCTTPLGALTDDRDALLAVAMNGEPLPVDHGFPARLVVPGLYGYVSATKWVVDLEVTRFEDATAYWTERGWAERGPVKTMSRIDVPERGATVEGGRVVVAGVAWAQHVGVERVELQVDGGPWQRAYLSATPSVDTWVQWSLAVDLDSGEHEVVVRATDRGGYTQTSVRSDVRPDGATGWHDVTFTVA